MRPAQTAPVAASATKAACLATANPGPVRNPAHPEDTGGAGSDYSDTIDDLTNADVSANAVMSTPEQPVQKIEPDIEYPFRYVLLQIRRDGGNWWNANQIISRLRASDHAAPARAGAGARACVPRPGARAPRRPRRPRPNPSSTRRAVLPVAVVTTWRPTSAVGRCSERRSSPRRSRLRAPSALRRLRRLWRREPD